MSATEYEVRLKRPHGKQQEFLNSKAKRKVIRAGRRGGKTTGISIYAVREFLKGKRILYAAPTQDQVESFWWETKRALQAPLDAGVFYKNESLHVVELPDTKQRIRAKTAWNADSLRGDFCDLLIIDEWQLCNEEMWGVVGAPMLADNDGDAVFIYTPPSLRSRSASKADDPQHAAKLFKKAKADTSGRWETFHFASRDNPFISQDAIEELAGDMTSIAYRMEILAEDVDEAPGALWTRQIIEANRTDQHPDLERVVVGVDPSATSGGDEAGVVTAGRARDDGYVIEDNTIQGSPTTWATAAVSAYNRHKADCIVAESNNGGEMVALTIATIDPSVPVRLVHASRGKATRAEPISSLYEKGRVHHVGNNFAALEDEQCLWMPGDDSPNRMDAAVWALTELMLGPKGNVEQDEDLADFLSDFRGR